MTFQVSVAFDWPKIIEKEEKYNKKMQLSPYILAGWLLDATAGPVRKKAIVKTKDRHIVEIRSATAKDLARGDLLDLSNYQLDQIRQAKDFGVRMAVGTDAGSPATFLAVRTKPERVLDTLGTPERVYFKGIPLSSLGSEGRRES